MTPVTLLVIPALLIMVFALETVLERSWATPWKKRGYTLTVITDPLQARRRILWPLAVGALAVLTSGAPAYALALAAATWLAAVAILTDVTDQKIPTEATQTVTIIGLLLAASTLDWMRLAATIGAFLLVGALLYLTAFATSGALGGGDVRLYLAFTPLAAWLGIAPLLYGILIACVVQLLVIRPLYRRRRPTGLRAATPFAPALVAGIALVVALSGSPTVTGNDWTTVLSNTITG